MISQGIYQNLYDAAENFIRKVDSGQARSTESYSEFKKALALIDAFDKIYGKDGESNGN